MALAKFLCRLFCSHKEQQAAFETKKEEAPQSVDVSMRYLVAGLGNIGPEYAQTRHNMGFMVLDQWAGDADVVFKTERYGDVACVNFKGCQFWLLKPSTYMNLSGNAVRYWMNKLSIPIEQIVVICDDLNLPFGTLRMKTRGSDGGHNGLKHIIATLESSEFTRIRMGIGNNFQHGEQIDFVLGKLSPEELETLPQLAKKVIGGVKTFALDSAQRAMNTVNTKE